MVQTSHPWHHLRKHKKMLASFMGNNGLYGLYGWVATMILWFICYVSLLCHVRIMVTKPTILWLIPLEGVLRKQLVFGKASSW